MQELIKKLEQLLDKEEIDLKEVQNLKAEFLKKHIKGLKIDDYIGDYPTFMEPVILGEKVKIGDDVLIGPNIYIGSNSIIGDYVEISNSIVLDNVTIGDNIKLVNCVIAGGSKLNFSNFNEKNCILKGTANSIEELEMIYF
ncbi:hypothetical protein LCGC14_0632370 [marine sediment metagenome]|uniref:Mannose-1-phosphate guanyltransferase C-terminal domain-containing protein n=1 Tax=marine sediment metagenome TaxID=412755 RepID=A0A0F9R6U3_9ZZZZ|nr:MAG: UDP-3-O-(3-hydroxymyristoyl)glucosamine N-acyltransferase [Candidatus Lokiarchaeum sp. GC14_75]